MNAGSFHISDLVLINQENGPVPSVQSLSYDVPTKTVTYFLNAVPHDDNYSATLNVGSILSTTGFALASPFSFNFFELAGDANHDRSVDNADFTALFNHFLMPNATIADGDFNYDGIVDNADFTILFNNFTKTLPPPPAATVATIPTVIAPTRRSPAALCSGLIY